MHTQENHIQNISHEDRRAPHRRRAAGPMAAVLGIVLCCALATTVFAVDGVIELNHRRALTGGPGDAPGYPIILTTPGSYVLTGELTPPDENTTGIEVHGEGTTIDLNGFAIRGPASCSGAGAALACVPVGTGAGIQIAASDVTILDGVITGVGGSGIAGGAYSNLRMADLRIVDNAGFLATNGGGIDLRDADGVTVERCLVSNNSAKGVWLGAGARIVDSRILGNREIGVLIWGVAANIRHNVIGFNGDQGINVQFAGASADGGVLIGNVLYGNLTGLNTDNASVAYGENFFESNPNGPLTGDGGGVQLGLNGCNGNTTCP